MDRLIECGLQNHDEMIRTKYGFELCEFKSEGSDCEDCKKNPSGEDLYFHSGGGEDCREGSYRCEGCVATFIRELEVELAVSDKINALIQELLKLTQEQRLDVLNEFCHSCGTDDLPCRCWDDR